ncbi:hypothetical protein PIB30_018939 [Stylosanthes scabra]|uniref:F-box domain-containing protein n=1 Tax=Stylosanthes scabra TaxID=79078 RepID=A0ABU6YA19_9FABA|nr:hypothetical protein [Stylosanthes scabra]
MAIFFAWSVYCGSRVLWRRDDGVVGRCNLLTNTANDANPLSPTLLPMLPDDILLEILLRLSVRVLLRFKRVCKSWRTLISSPQFAIDNFRRHLSSANRHLPSRLVYANWNYYHCLVGVLPLQPLFNSPLAITKVVSFQPRGFQISNWLPRYQRLLQCFPYPAVVGLSGCVGKFVSGTGTLNWMAKLSGGGGGAAFIIENRWVILSLDLANESFGQLQLPHISRYNACDSEMQVLRNCLCFTIDHRNTVFDVWIMKEYGVRSPGC